ncbi:hypothetical protein SteCoe_5673 [Stentor coeruleus]|uniref:Uncharacterized protein n=1 Tax=Stentor coeruleus TaxID=5963 RepID=A0A1R2CS11_9CILI|nr:hypothetical protein SteCoe_5673 [Stentor coeruleus]
MEPSLQNHIWELEKLQNSISQRIQELSSTYHEHILSHQTALQGLGAHIKNLSKKSEFLQQKTNKLGNELQSNLEKMSEGVKKLEKVQEAGEIVKTLQQFLFKLKKSRTSDNKELEELSSKLAGLNIVEKLYRQKV